MLQLQTTYALRFYVAVVFGIDSRIESALVIYYYCAYVLGDVGGGKGGGKDTDYHSMFCYHVVELCSFFVSWFVQPAWHGLVNNTGPDVYTQSSSSSPSSCRVRYVPIFLPFVIGIEKLLHGRC